MDNDIFMMKAKLLTKLKLVKDTMQFDFELMAGEIIFLPGQFLSIKLPDVRSAGDESNVRYFSIVSSPNQTKKFSIATRLSSSAFKQALFNLVLGSEVEVGAIGGVMTLPTDTDQPLVFIAGGIGITPFMSMLAFVKENKTEHKITLLYSNRTRPSSAYFDELAKLEEELPNFKVITTMTDDEYWAGEKRLVDHEFIKEKVPDFKQAKYLVAGPPPMVLAMANNFDRLGITKDHYILEEFFGY
jgi:ferredoxin-NADP reductase